jgi:hypothetical protein
MREPVDSALRTALALSGTPFKVIYGSGESRMKNALLCLNLANHMLSADITAVKVAGTDKNRSRRLQSWVCERCSDPVCEHRLFRDLIEK